MRALTLVAFLAVAFTAIAAAPHAKTSVVHHKVNNHVGVQQDLVDYFIDFISLVLGIDVRAVFAQTPITIAELNALLVSSYNELVEILASAGADVIAEAESIINAALVKAQEVVAPIWKIIEAIIGLITRRAVPN